MRFLFVGAGAVGVGFASKLARSGAEVSLVARSDYEVASKRGYEVQTLTESWHFTPAAVLRSAAEYPGIADCIVFCGKALPQYDPAAAICGAVRSAKTSILLIQNGIGIEEPVIRAFPDNPLISCVANCGASRPAPGVVLNKGIWRLKMGNYPAGILPQTREIAGLFRSGGVDCQLFEKIAEARWYKLLWNLPFNVVSVLAGCDTIPLVEDPLLSKLCRDLMEESRQVAASCGVTLTEKDVEDNFEFTRNLPAFIPSTCQDYLAGKAMEVEAILGTPLRIAEKNKIPVPCMKLCYALMNSLNRRQLKSKS